MDDLPIINELGCGVEDSSGREKERVSSCIVVIIEFEMAGSYIEEQLVLGHISLIQVYRFCRLQVYLIKKIIPQGTILLE
jgi:hypothetical protein